MEQEATVWVEHLGPQECWALLRSRPVGRLGVLHDSAPEIYPINHIVDGGAILFRSSGGTKLRGLDRNPSVCYQVDDFDEHETVGWSVLVKGRATLLTDPEDLRRADDLPLELWALDGASVWIRITPSEITGRRIGRH